VKILSLHYYILWISTFLSTEINNFDSLCNCLGLKSFKSYQRTPDYSLYFLCGLKYFESRKLHKLKKIVNFSCIWNSMPCYSIIDLTTSNMCARARVCVCNISAALLFFVWFYVAAAAGPMCRICVVEFI
jgi:hypothetical protein